MKKEDYIAKKNKELCKTHKIKEPCPVFGKGFLREEQDCINCEIDCKEYSEECRVITLNLKPKESEGEEVATKTKGKNKKLKKEKKKDLKLKKSKSAKKKASGNGDGLFREGTKYAFVHDLLEKGVTMDELVKKLSKEYGEVTGTNRNAAVYINTIKKKVDVERNEDGVYQVA